MILWNCIGTIRKHNVMDSLKTLHSEVIKTSEQNQLLSEAGNKDLWLRALEKNGLYSSLDQFEVIDGKQVPERADKQQSASPLLKSKNKVQQHLMLNNKGSQNARNVQGRIDGNDKSMAVSINGNAKVSSQNQAVNHYQYLNNLLSTNKKGIRVTGLVQDYVASMQWTSKNTTITKADSGLEVWVRDSSLIENKLSNVLKHLRHSMASLGASLSKVTINGKVAYHAHQHSRMEG